ncbi:tRNA (5-methylaminomethyl-2-thiouridine)(34)-methyltransferase MnmD [Palleronia sp. THAF1]|uniref:tRNA (5-methylaminomethyl-2-thiouridine)(34)-methyltransferase MnmD n=1 Tax=Palleronia sp. THAF1 TaxID=2587842 RepID=UPI000F531AD3|nr:tRNA (5-methylaminomethyl-2-thiouridine)(34)-methyltransferase MnmD [Palleronia sp. THAF1]
MSDEKVTWRDGVPVSVRFDDPYYSLQDGVAETRHTFLAGNGLPGRLVPGFRIAELGFGTGLNAVCLLSDFRRISVGPFRDAPLRYTAFEKHPLSTSEMERALAGFPIVAKAASELLDAWDGHRAELDGIVIEVIKGDARETLPGWEGRADAWFLDGFAPAKNPELWEAELMTQVAAHTAPGGTFATYTAAGQVRRDLAAVGFDVQRVPGYGRKRHMSVGRLA